MPLFQRTKNIKKNVRKNAEALNRTFQSQKPNFLLIFLARDIVFHPIRIRLCLAIAHIFRECPIIFRDAYFLSDAVVTPFQHTCIFQQPYNIALQQVALVAHPFHHPLASYLLAILRCNQRLDEAVCPRSIIRISLSISITIV